jgi:ubiquinone/menaquinone biosynthesis C-methylase UbiE
MSSIANNSYDFVLSCHNLEHFANPIKALKEWGRVARPGGTLVMVLPYYSKTFDHRRSPTQLAHLISDFEHNTQEDDLTHLPEILQLHDLRRDPFAGSVEQFRERSLKNIENRCLHHHVFDERNSGELLRYLGMHIVAIEQAYPFHLFIVANFRD